MGRQQQAPSSARRTNHGILLLVCVSLLSGVLAFAIGTAWVRLVVVVHAVAGLGLLVLLPGKTRISRRGLRRRGAAAAWPSLVLALAVTVAVLTGLLHSTGLALSYGPLDDMQLHVGAAVVATPLLVWHVVARGPIPTRHDLDRRAMLRAALLVGVAGTLLGTREGISSAAGLPGASRRASGSFEQGSHAPAQMPRTIWLFDPRPELDPDQWRLTISAGAEQRVLTVDDLPRDDRVTAVLDCTSGWWAEQDWSGVRLDRLLGTAPSSVRSIQVGSHTGYTRRFPLRDLSHLWLATHYEDQPLAPGHGAPARLVAPGRRGFWWVKWVTSITLDPAPWWRQPPFPLQ